RITEPALARDDEHTLARDVGEPALELGLVDAAADDERVIGALVGGDPQAAFISGRSYLGLDRLPERTCLAALTQAPRPMRSGAGGRVTQQDQESRLCHASRHARPPVG